jgi:hypothetical protein
VVPEPGANENAGNSGPKYPADSVGSHTIPGFLVAAEWLFALLAPVPGENLPDDQARAAEFLSFKWPDPNNPAFNPPEQECFTKAVLIKMLVEPDRDHVRPDLFDRAEHIVQVPENSVINRFQCPHHLQ